ncbi:hypothetical protein CO026_01485 [Candidatus Kaiserbacteria bacterium CG_4_9_14_0_2_um_filter_41_32]|uniref:ParB-like N-terminal domain-containing protein n=1 Tax=Candidatus Kaiserbacteria bacterium CG_4_9_14_0_2_um_filter_41_32 TaxID=1974601 RepID=A0A2M8FF20_9BACT|nr:MAG: hypothetical protein CO026_01485 [Candidatus Kaiserbacteria bacterium CG_4_9_14_0_2_um_filter_41_32]
MYLRALGIFGGDTLGYFSSIWYLTMAFQGDSIFWVEVEKIVANPYQPRREFDEQKLKELAESVRMYGILQPLTVTRKEVPSEDGSFRSEYELIAGERRLRASKIAGLSQVPVIIREGEQSEQEKLELAIIENLQREDLNAVDRAMAFRQLADVFNLSHSQVGKKVGRSREYISNSIRLLHLPDYMLNSLRSADISEGHARTLLMLNDRPEEQDTVFREILLKKLTVRDVERIARGIAVEKTRRKDNVDFNLLELERQFTETLGTRVSIVKTEFGGKMTIDYFSEEDLEAILLRMRDEAKQIKQELPASGENREWIKLEEDKDEKNALEKLTASTGLEMLPLTIIDDSKNNIASQSKSETGVPTLAVPIVPKIMKEAPMPTVSVAVEDILIRPAVTVPSPTHEEEKKEYVSDSVPVTPPVIKTGNSLRDQLVVLLGQKPTFVPNPPESTTPIEPTMPPVTPPSKTDEVDTLIPKPEKPTTDKTNDDSSLYSMNNFGV